MAGKIDIKQLKITETPDGTKVLRDDGSWRNISELGSSFVSQTLSIDGKVVNSTTLYTVPAGKKFYLLELNIEPTTVTGAGDGPKVSLGTNSTPFNNMIALTDLKTLKTVGDFYSIDAEGVVSVGNAGQLIKINNSVTASTTTYIYKAHLVGYLA